MREILFRGKRIDNGDFVFGMPWIFEDHACICPWDKGMCKYDTGYYPVPVIPETVGQYTGLTDKNGKRIFEGDIVCHYNENPFTKSTDIEKGEVFWDKDFCGWRRTTNHVFHSGVVDTYRMSSQCVYEVIGNIHDNPEKEKGQG